MLNFKSSDPLRFSRVEPRAYLLWFFWLLGVTLGFFCALQIPSGAHFLTRSLVVSGLSAVSLFLTLFLPFLLSAFFVCIKKPILVVFLAFFKAFIFAWCASCIISGFGYAGWLIRWLLLFSDSCVAVILHWFWFRILAAKSSTVKKDMIISAVFIMLILFADYNVITPFLMSLFV